MSWYKYFIDMLPHVASKSKDTSTKVGAIIIDHNNIIVATGYNGFPRGVREDEGVPERFERPIKYSYTEHAERNAIYAAARKGIALEGCTIYIGWLPCTDCARGIIQCGINTIVIDGRDYELKKKYWDERWLEDFVTSMTMLREASVEVYRFDDRNGIQLVTDYIKSGDSESWHKEKDTGTTQ